MNYENKFKIIAKTSYGLEEVLAEEIKQLGIKEVEIATRAVIFEGTKETLYKTNLWLRSANRLIVPIKTFKIKDADDLYHKVKNIAWEDILVLTKLLLLILPFFLRFLITPNLLPLKLEMPLLIGLEISLTNVLMLTLTNLTSE